jgi:hypothetical protein
VGVQVKNYFYCSSVNKFPRYPGVRGAGAGGGGAGGGESIKTLPPAHRTPRVVIYVRL